MTSNLKNFDNKFEIKINKQYSININRKGKKSLRPYISIEKKINEPKIVIELTIDLGYKGRKDWYQKFNKKIQKYQELGLSHNNIFWIVITTENWLPEFSYKAWNEVEFRKQKKKVNLPEKT